MCLKDPHTPVLTNCLAVPVRAPEYMCHNVNISCGTHPFQWVPVILTKNRVGKFKLHHGDFGNISSLIILWGKIFIYNWQTFQSIGKLLVSDVVLTICLVSVLVFMLRFIWFKSRTQKILVLVSTSKIKTLSCNPFAILAVTDILNVDFSNFHSKLKSSVQGFDNVFPPLQQE